MFSNVVKVVLFSVLIGFFVSPFSVAAQESCSLVSNFEVGNTAQVTPGDPNTVRSAPATNSSKLGEIPGGEIFIVTGDAECHNGHVWLPLDYNGQEAWTSMGKDIVWVVNLSPSETPCMSNPNAIGEVCQLKPGPRLVVLSDMGSEFGELTFIPGGASFLVLEAPRQFEGSTWLHVSYSGIPGWIPFSDRLIKAEIEKTCTPNPDISPVNNGESGRITPGTANRMRIGPSRRYMQNGRIPGGESFSVIGPVECHDNILWIPVQYGDEDGWTMEGEFGVHWVEADD